jgi:hypothetical protein
MSWAYQVFNELSDASGWHLASYIRISTALLERGCLPIDIAPRGYVELYVHTICTTLRLIDDP